MTSGGRSVAARMQRIRRLARMGTRRVASVAEREWFGPDALINIAAAASNAGAFEPHGWAALEAALHDFPTHAAWWAGLRDLASITGGDPAAMDPISDEEEPSDGPTTPRIERRGDVFTVA